MIIVNKKSLSEIENYKDSMTNLNMEIDSIQNYKKDIINN
jgi:hypothetical protein